MSRRRIAFFICMLSPLILSAAESDPAAVRSYTRDDLLRVARERSPAILAAEQRVRAAAGERTNVATLPSIQSSYSRGTGRGVDVGAVSAAAQGWEISQEWEWPWRWRARIRAADSGVAAQRAEKLIVEADVFASVAEQFYGILLAQKEEELLREQFAAARDLLALTEKRVAVGEGRPLERIKASVEALRTERQLEAARADLSVRRALLDRFLLESLGKDYVLTGDLSLPDSIPSQQATLDRILASSPLIAQVRIRVEAAHWAVRAEELGRFPNLSASFGREREIDRKASTFTVGISIPLWGFNRGLIQKVKAEEDVVRAEEASARIEVASRAEGAYKVYSLSFQQAESYDRDLLPAARKSLSIATFSYEQGELSLLELLDARRTYLETISAFNDVLYQFHIAAAEIERLAGGSIHE